MDNRRQTFFTITCFNQMVLAAVVASPSSLRKVPNLSCVSPRTIFTFLRLTERIDHNEKEGHEGVKWELGFAYFGLGKWDLLYWYWDLITGNGMDSFKYSNGISLL